MRVMLALALACGAASAPPEAPAPSTSPTPGLNPTSPEAPPKRTGPRQRVVVAEPEPVTPPAAMPSPDPPEPEQPRAECKFTREVHCHNEASADTCPPTLPAQSDRNLLPGDGRYSASETRTARRTAAWACCYVEFVATVCR